MRLVEALQIAAALMGALATAFTAIEGRFVGRFRRAAATSPERAIELPPLGVIGRWRRSRLGAAGAVVDAEGGTVYLNETAYAALRRSRRLRAVTAVLLVLASVVLVHRVLR
jgi:hypothetical protein